LKLVRNYNKTVNNTKNEVVSIQDPSINLAKVSKNNPNILIVKMEKRILDRGYEIQTEIDMSKSSHENKSVAYGIGYCNPFIYWMNGGFQWYGFVVSVSFSNCAVAEIVGTSNGIGIAFAILGGWCGASTAGVCALPLWSIAGAIALSGWSMETANRWCGSRGIIFKYKNSYIWYIPVFVYYQCP